MPAASEGKEVTVVPASIIKPHNIQTIFRKTLPFGSVLVLYQQMTSSSPPALSGRSRNFNN